MSESHVVIESVELSAVNVDNSYQRGLKPHHKKIAKNFDPKAVGVLTVNRRPDRSLWSIDGQQRRAALMLLKITHWLAEVYNLDTVAKEAELFARKNGSEGTVVRVGERDRFKAAVLAQDPTALSVLKAVEEGGLKVPVGMTSSFWPNINSTALLTRFHAVHGASLITAATKIIATSWPGDTDALKGTMLDAILAFVSRYPKADMARAARQFATVPAFRVIQEGKKTEGMHTSGVKACDFLVYLYNKRLTAANKLKSMWRDHHGPENEQV